MYELCLIDFKISKSNIFLKNVPVNYNNMEDYKFLDPHWMAVIIINENSDDWKEIDYLEYTDAKESYSSLLDLNKKEFTIEV